MIPILSNFSLSTFSARGGPAFGGNLSTYFHPMSDCIFCKIIQEEIPATIRYEDERVLAFDDIHPAAATHVLIIPKEHIPTALDISESQQELMGHLFLVAKKIAQEKGILGYKLVMNVGQEGGQVVMHIHLHMLAGKLERDIASL